MNFLRFAFLLIVAFQMVGTVAPLCGASLDSVEYLVVKLYGQGGVQGIEGYQTGLLVSNGGNRSDKGLILTVDSPVIGGGELLAVLPNGDRYSAQVRSVDSRWDIALLKIELDGVELSCFSLVESSDAEPTAGMRAYAISNTFNIASGKEPVSRQRATVAALTEVSLFRLNRSPRKQKVLLLDAVISNPGSAGGAVVDASGRLLGMIGKESRSILTGKWLNYALPTSVLRDAMQMMANDDLPLEEQGENRSARQPGGLLQRFGMAMVPIILPRTPPLIEFVRSNSLADRAGLHEDDLIVSINSVPVSTVGNVESLLRDRPDRVPGEPSEPFRMVVLRGEELMMLTLESGE